MDLEKLSSGIESKVKVNPVMAVLSLIRSEIVNLIFNIVTGDKTIV